MKTSVHFRSLSFNEEQLARKGFKDVHSVKVEIPGHDRPELDLSDGLVLEDVDIGQVVLITAFGTKAKNLKSELLGTATLRVGAAEEMADQKVSFRRQGKPVDLSAEVSLIVPEDLWHTLPAKSSDISRDQPPPTPRSEKGLLETATAAEAEDAGEDAQPATEQLVLPVPRFPLLQASGNPMQVEEEEDARQEKPERGQAASQELLEAVEGSSHPSPRPPSPLPATASLDLRLEANGNRSPPRFRSTEASASSSPAANPRPVATAASAPA